MKTLNDKAVQKTDELREHYSFDYSKAKPNRFANRFGEGATVIVLDPDVAAVFTTSEEANQALRRLITTSGDTAKKTGQLEKVKDSV